MWHTDFASRLHSWSELRRTAVNLPLSQALDKINHWWFDSPWKSYYLHWDDIASWPDPWQLLDDNTYCELARGLGILYTLSLIQHKDLKSAELILTSEGYNLVLVNKGEYILNWDPEIEVNTAPIKNIKRRLTLEQSKQMYN